ncbi:MAG: flagellar biosynthetic protein FliO [Defluviitaleaceae bacterium]|nr:flagellar biosynthetic protein FliO [Defluviitaleaceae bacterium]
MPGFMTLTQTFGFLLALAFVVVLAIFVTRFVAGQRLRGFNNRNIKIIESIGVGHQGSICILQIGTNYILVGITKENITFLQNVDSNNITVSPMENFQTPFKKYLDGYTRKGEQDDSKE